MIEAGLLEVMRSRNWRQKMRDSEYGYIDISLAQLLLVHKRVVMQNYHRYMNNLIAVTREPYAAHVPEPVIPKDPLIHSFCLIASRLRFAYEANATQNALLLVSLALHTYYAEHGSYPAALTALIPDYLSAIPADPFALKDPLRYKKTNKSYVLYSIGPDGKDDGGTPCMFGKVNLPIVTPVSTGDIVAGVNIR